MSNFQDLEKKRSVRELDNDDEENQDDDNKRIKLGDNVKNPGHAVHSGKTYHEPFHNEIEGRSDEESASEENITLDNSRGELKFRKGHEDLIESELQTKIKTNKLAATKISNDGEVSKANEASIVGINSDGLMVENLLVKKDSYNSNLELKIEAARSDCEDQIDDTSTIKSEGSEKENIDIKKENSQSPDVIMLSDEDDLKAMKEEGTPEAAVCRARILKKIKALQNQLRNEEATLVLLKKLRQSQITQPPENNQQVPQSRPQPPPKHINQHQRPHRDPPPLVRGSQPISKTLHNVTQNPHMWGQNMNNQSSRSQQGPPPPPPLVMVSRASNGHGSLSQQQSHVARGIVPQSISRSNDNNRNQQRMQQQTQQQQQQITQKPAQVPQAPSQPQDTQTPAQRQAAAKQALRKQLEKTLLQIPPPKPPPPEMNFIPSLACPDFILLLGLEEVVNHMIDFQLIARGQKNPDERFVCTPFTCVQCDSDFTPVWKREKPGSKNVICEHCVTTNQKKALKQEHTNRLKSAFVKALQQEQEIERMQASTPTLQPSSSSTPQPQHSSAPMISAASAAAAAANVAAAAAAANFRPSAEQLRQHHNFFQQAQLRAGQPLGLQAFSHRTPFPYNIPFAKQQDLQRQYLLDMIPRGSMPWKQ